MKLRDLLPEAAPNSRIDEIEVAGVTSDSRKVKPGFLFVAIAGNKTDGARFVKQAASDGAVALAAEQRPDTLPDAMAFTRAANPRRSLALAAAKYLSSPAGDHRGRHRHKRQDLGCRFHAPDLERRSGTRPRASARSASSRRRANVYGSLTTPDPVELHRTLDQLAGKASRILRSKLLRTVSISIASTGCASRPAAFTNLSRDHLDYHPTHRSLSRRQAAAVRENCSRRAARP